MPVIITQRCWECKLPKPRNEDNFPFRRRPGTIAQKMYLPYCRDCLRRNPGLWAEAERASNEEITEMGEPKQS